MIELQRQIYRLLTLRIAERKSGQLRRDVDVQLAELVEAAKSIRPLRRVSHEPEGNLNDEQPPSA